MDYKKIVKSQNLRFKILNLVSWIPDKTMVKIQYRIKLGRKLNLRNPKRFTEKLQRYKLYYRKPVMHQCVDKYEVRKYVKSKGLDSILNELYGVYDRPEDIDFDKLPKKFVIKTTSGTGGQNVFICEDKDEIDIGELKNKLVYWLSLNPKKSFGREWAYEGNRNRIIIEKYIESEAGGLVDYKFFCFNGKVKYIYLIADRKLGQSAKLAIYDRDFKKLNYYRGDEGRLLQEFKRPKSFSEMVAVAEKISEGFPHVRVDLYNNSGKIIFGEMTFYDGSGYMSYEPDCFDFILGEEFEI